MRRPQLRVFVPLTGIMLLASVIALRSIGDVHGASSPPDASVATMALATPLKTASMSSATALGVAKQQFGNGVFSDMANVSVSYGAFNDPALMRAGNTGAQVPVGTRDVWEITVGNLDVPRPTCGSVTATCPPLHTLTIIIDDQDGTLLVARAD